jgi:hypothetical protein
MVSLDVLSPVAQRGGKSQVHAAQRLQTLRGAVIGLYDNGKPGGDIVQAELIERLGSSYPDAQFRHYSGSVGGRATLNEQGARLISKECDAVIGIRAD